MKRETQFVTFALVIVLSVVVVAATSQEVFTATGQNVLPTYITSTTGANPDTPIFIAAFSQSGLQVQSTTGLLDMSVDGYHVYGSNGVYFVQNIATGVVHAEVTMTNNLPYAITVTPNIGFFGSDIGRAGVTGVSPELHTSTFMGTSAGCPARGSLVNPGSWLTPALPSVADGTQDHVTMNYQVSTLNISNSSKATNSEPIVGPSVRNEFLKLHPNETNTSPAANQVQLQQSLCTVTTKIGNVSFNATTIQPGQTVTVESNVNSTDWGFPCSPVSNALINYNVHAGSTTYQALKTSEVIVFSPQESNICGS
jgi:hypothetical protein